MSKTATGILLGLVVAVAIGVIVVALARFDLTGKGGNRLSGDFNYDQSQFEKIDPALIGYRPAGSFRVELPRPSALAVAPGGIYVAAEKALGAASSWPGGVLWAAGDAAAVPLFLAAAAGGREAGAVS